MDNKILPFSFASLNLGNFLVSKGKFFLVHGLYKMFHQTKL